MQILIRICLPSGLVLSVCSKSEPVDERLIGAWHTTLGQWTLSFEPNADGHYRTTFNGPFTPPVETGEIEARDGHWQVRKDSGEADGGTYFFVHDDTVIFQGSKGAITWQRAGATAPAPITPLPAPPPTATTTPLGKPIQGE
jgi:hypothetical protein